MKKKIVVVDDHILIARAINGIVQQFAEFEPMYECENGQQLLDRLKGTKDLPDIILLDVNMPVMDGIETCKQLTEHYPGILVMALSMQDDENSVIQMIRNGAKGYLLKNVHPVELERAFKTLSSVGSYFPDWVTQKIIVGLGKPETKQAAVHITDREKEFLQYTITEMSYKEIAEKMYCSPRTVESYRDSLFEKLNLKTRVGLAVYAMKNGFA